MTCFENWLRTSEECKDIRTGLELAQLIPTTVAILTRAALIKELKTEARQRYERNFE